MPKRYQKAIVGVGALVLLGVGFASFIFFDGTMARSRAVKYVGDLVAQVATSTSVTSSNNQDQGMLDAASQTPRIARPAYVKGIYMTSWVAGVERLRAPLIKLIEDTELNAIVIDIKDYTGKISFEPRDERLRAMQTYEKRISDLDDLIARLHAKNIYVIGRISVFQDALMAERKPEWAVLSAKTGKQWADRKGVTWIDAGNREFWDYINDIARESVNRGFDEINFDYIRFPSDGVMADAVYPSFDTFKKSADYQSIIDRYNPRPEVATVQASTTATTTKAVAKFDPLTVHKIHTISSFLEHGAKPLKERGVPVSADLFGMVTTHNTDLNIGQLLEPALRAVDVVSPMVYPSHYPNGWNGLANPAAEPYTVIKVSMGKGLERAKALGLTEQSLRPWLQDFDLGADYDAAKVRAQIRALDELGISSWLMWNASNKYTNEAYLTN